MSKRDILPLVLACGLLAACGSMTNHQRFVGLWGLDVDRMLVEDRIQTPDRAATERELRRTRYRNSVDRIVLYGTSKEEQSATYQVVEDNGRLLVIERRTDGKDGVERVTFRFRGDNHMVGEGGSEGERHFVRAKE